MQNTVRLLSFCGLMILLVLIAPPRTLHAQDTATTCAAVVEELLHVMATACEGLQDGDICYGDGTRIPAQPPLALRTQAFSNTTDGHRATWLMVPTTQRQEPLQLTLIGDAQLETIAPITTPSAYVEITNTTDLDINLRAGPALTFDLVGSLASGEAATATLRTTDATWLHVQTNAFNGWLFAEQLSLSMDLFDDLAAIENGPYFSPLQQLVLSTQASNSTCGMGSTGLLLHDASDYPSYLQINGVNIAFKRATLLVQADDTLDLYVIEGEVTVSTPAGDQTIAAGMRVNLDDEGTINTTANMAFSTLFNMPFALVGASPGCIVGTTAASDNVISYRLPSDDASLVAPLSVSNHYRVIAQQADDRDGWWQIDNDGQRAWVRQTDVQSIGECTAISSSMLDAGSTEDAATFVPVGTSVWQAVASVDTMTGDCSALPIATCDHLVAIIEEGDSIAWRGQEPLPYSMAPADSNTFTYNGRNHLDNAELSLSITFESETTWSMTWTQVFDNEPDCTHTFSYQADFVR